MDIDWKDIYLDDVKSIYKVSTTGKIFSSYLNKNIKQSLSKDGYCVIRILCNNKKYSKRVHRLVAEAFIPNPENKPQVNHKDGNKQNNHVDNLEWVTNKENAQHAWRNGLIPIRYGEQVGSSEYTEKQILEVIDYILKGYSNFEIAKITGIKKRTIKAVKSKTEWTYLTKDIVWPEFFNTFKRYKEFKNIPSGYIRNLILNGYTNNEIYEKTGLEKSLELHKIFNKIRSEKIRSIKRQIKEIKNNIRFTQQEKDKRIVRYKKYLKLLKHVRKLSNDYWFNENKDYYNLKEILNDSRFEEVFIFTHEMKYV